MTDGLVPSVPAALSLVEHRRLDELETVVERGLAALVEAGAALLEIRESRLYRRDYPTWGSTANSVGLHPFSRPPPHRRCPDRVDVAHGQRGSHGC